MQCLALSEIAQWLKRNSVTPNPYTNAARPIHYVQFRCPTRHLAVEAFIRDCFESVLNAEELLIHVTDWPLYEQSEMVAINGIRKLCGESRPLIDAPGHLLSSEECDIAISIFGLTTSFEWDAYLYLPKDFATMYNWEGELFDFWTNESDNVDSVRKLVGKFGLVETTVG